MQGLVKRCHMHRFFRNRDDQLNRFIVDNLVQVTKVLVRIERRRSDPKRSANGARSARQMTRIGFGNNHPPAGRMECTRNIKRLGQAPECDQGGFGH